MTTPIINVDITSTDQIHGEMVGRLLSATLNEHGFEDVSIIAQPQVIETDSDVVEAMRGLCPDIFNCEVVIETSTFETDSPALAAIDDDGSGGGFPDPDVDEDSTPIDD